MNPWINADVIQIKRWTNNLFSLILNAAIAPFHAGQFTKLAIYDQNSMKQKKIQRAYSYLNPPNEKNLEFYIVRILNGKFSNLLYNLKNGDKIFIKERSFGFFIVDEIPTTEILWMFATGTAIGPYLSILKEGKNLDKFKKIVLIHAVRYQNELIYLPSMQELHTKYCGKLIIQTIVSREKHKNSLTGRIPFLLKNRALENNVGLSINRHNSHVMLCGNPFMVEETCLFLKNHRSMEKNLRRKKGNITIENYW